jgi:hypothetical protein
VYIAYLDESGVVEPAGTTHFVLVAFAIPASRWKDGDARLQTIKAKHRLAENEVHTAWLLRRYPEQDRIPDLDKLSDVERRIAVKRERKIDLAKASLRGEKAVNELAKNYKKTEAYVHLTYAERVALVRDFADEVGRWSDARIFGDAQEKAAYPGYAAAMNPDRAGSRKEGAGHWKVVTASPESIRERAFEQVVSRFQIFLASAMGAATFGMLVHDQNQTACINLTALMRAFHKDGTAYAKIPNIIETPLFVDSSLTSMVQVADLVSYAVRRFVEKDETDLLDRVYPRFDRRGGVMVGLRHYTGARPCACRICVDHGRT